MMNTMRLIQLYGLTVYEFRMHWRRRALLIISLALLLMLVVSMLILGDSMRQANGIDPELFRRVATATVLFSTWAPFGSSLAVVLPIMVADTIPLDRQYGVGELLDSFPLPYWVYLTGKLLGVWAAVLAGLGAIMVLS